MPGELLPDCRKMGADLRPGHALLDRFAAADAGGNLPIGMKAEQLAATENALRLLGRAHDKILHQHLVAERSIRAEFSQGGFEVVVVAQEPDAAAGGANGS